MNKKRWVAALALCADEVESIVNNVIVIKLKNGESISIPVYVVDDDEIQSFDPKKIIESYNKASNLNTDEFHGAD